jgi:hypothetical protein
MNELFEKNLNIFEDLSNGMKKKYLMAKDNNIYKILMMNLMISGILYIH